MRPNRVELTVPISEGELLDFLLSRYPPEHLERVGINPGASVIRGLDFQPDGEGGMKCNFQVCTITLVDAEALFEEDAQKMREIHEQKAQEVAAQENAGNTGESCGSTQGEGCAPARMAANLQHLRIEKQEKF